MRSSAPVVLCILCRRMLSLVTKQRQQTCISRFDDETKSLFEQLYDKVDADVEFDKVEDAAYND